MWVGTAIGGVYLNLALRVHGGMQVAKNDKNTERKKEQKSMGLTLNCCRASAETTG
jgi:hypothetical protein